ncbi:RNA recognition motif domain containing protein [Reticulomyxa filosa]|uniref:RNA recognition motif domain containing protein n=1 Tax=Reticulomyxa filosa TaxID=46433 RepID=X6NNI6_RETFI|nr:RNA recognition motif domain containing protein [Reticulomyxa filosa]|eukprot:ETO26927.1 RNA recognition motif domain containing protein [Reticulomyxa filosa]
MYTVQPKNCYYLCKLNNFALSDTRRCKIDDEEQNWIFEDQSTLTFGYLARIANNDVPDIVSEHRAASEIGASASRHKQSADTTDPSSDGEMSTSYLNETDRELNESAENEINDNDNEKERDHESNDNDNENEVAEETFDLEKQTSEEKDESSNNGLWIEPVHVDIGRKENVIAIPFCRMTYEATTTTVNNTIEEPYLNITDRFKADWGHQPFR